MSNAIRKMERKKKTKEAKDLKKKMSKQIMMFDRMPEECVTCPQPFDKKSKEQAKSWHVVVRSPTVYLFCPNCTDHFVKLINEEAMSD
jgi:hypothetical protein|tara:strand:+ start:1044 stop:1307 length:264 start_codon:yes stop_codon:yes gene_type:complete